MKKVIDQSGGNKCKFYYILNKQKILKIWIKNELNILAMEHFEELIEMQEGSNDGVEDTPQGEKTAQPGEILDIEEVNVSFSIKKFI